MSRKLLLNSLVVRLTDGVLKGFEETASASRPFVRVPQPVTHYTPLREMSLQEAIAKRTAVRAYVANNQGLPVQFTPDEVHFIIDTGASVSITNSKEDFISQIPLIQPTKLKGIASGLDIKSVGNAE
jgi:hypothetical protein